VVLVVEDEPLVRMNSIDLVRELGFDVVEAVDADHAMAALESGQGITVLFTDIQMPGSMDGLQLAAAVTERWPPIAILITSGQLHPEDAHMPAGAQFMPKPYSPWQLEQQLRALTGGSGG
jgi:CheY-like chemotaxis protein